MVNLSLVSDTGVACGGMQREVAYRLEQVSPMKKKIVAVDDSQLVLDWVASTLRGHDIEVVSHDSPFGVWRLASDIMPDMILLDVNMPGMNGKAVCEIIKKRLPLMKVVFYSSSSKDFLETLVSQAKADGFIEKTENTQLFAENVKIHLKSGLVNGQAL
jgi:DNA-binding NarL/FixJ family response regulator